MVINPLFQTDIETSSSFARAATFDHIFSGEFERDPFDTVFSEAAEDKDTSSTIMLAPQSSIYAELDKHLTLLAKDDPASAVYHVQELVDAHTDHVPNALERLANKVLDEIQIHHGPDKLKQLLYDQPTHHFEPGLPTFSGPQPPNMSL